MTGSTRLPWTWPGPGISRVICQRTVQSSLNTRWKERYHVGLLVKLVFLGSQGSNGSWAHTQTNVRSLQIKHQMFWTLKTTNYPLMILIIFFLHSFFNTFIDWLSCCFWILISGNQELRVRKKSFSGVVSPGLSFSSIISHLCCLKETCLALSN